MRRQRRTPHRAHRAAPGRRGRADTCRAAGLALYDAAPSVRLRAAEAILDRLVQWIELEDVIRRLDALEAGQAAQVIEAEVRE